MYNDVTDVYHLIFEDWDASMVWQGERLDDLIRSRWGQDANCILDVTCGIGTQAIALANRGYSVTASDLSERSVERAKAEAIKRGLQIDFMTCDVRQAAQTHDAPFDVVISCDNALPHLLTDEEIRSALMQMFHCVREGGGVITTIRDYSQEREREELIPYGIRDVGGTRCVVFQTRRHDGDHYDVAMYFVTESDPPVVRFGRSRYYAISVARFSELMTESGFRDVQRLDDAFYQPVLIGYR